MTPEAAANWTPTRLSWVAETIVPQRDKPTDLTGDVPWVRIEDFNGKYISESHSGQGVNYDQIRSMPLRVFPPKTVVTSCSCTMGATAITTRPLITNQTFIGLVPDESRLSADFLYYLMQAKSDELQALATGAIQQYLSQDDFRSMRFALPPVSIQRRIADYLDRETAEIDSFIADLERFSTLAVERLNAVQDAVLSSVQSLPRQKLAWHVTFHNGDRGANYPSRDEFVDSGVPFINAGHLKSGSIFYDEMNYLTEEKFRSMGGAKLQNDDLLYCLRGSVGKCALFSGEAGALASSLVAIRPSSSLAPRYLLTWLNSAVVQSEVRSLLTGSAQPNLSVEQLSQLRLPVAPLAVQARIIAEIAEADRENDGLLSEVSSAVSLARKRRATLISAAVTGQIDVTDQGVSAAKQLRDELEVHV